ncbi:MAG: hypothetical protein ACJ8BC_13675, partial [Gemmatimonadales bacterium]
VIRATVPGRQVCHTAGWLGPLRTAEVSMTLTFLDPRTGSLVTIKVPEEPPRQPRERDANHVEG